ncbi:hypothetical protein [Alteromonas mediterranea]|uniref:hypothetical protein n=1 Tax=Alteromonas mediterranea TaxID=314275 RepID=UPI000B0D0268|nr:hypothetical protein [Alteromonas mediterranea]
MSSVNKKALSETDIISKYIMPAIRQNARDLSPLYHLSFVTATEVSLGVNYR